MLAHWVGSTKKYELLSYSVSACWYNYIKSNQTMLFLLLGNLKWSSPSSWRILIILVYYNNSPYITLNNQGFSLLNSYLINSTPSSMAFWLRFFHPKMCISFTPGALLDLGRTWWQEKGRLGLFRRGGAHDTWPVLIMGNKCTWLIWKQIHPRRLIWNLKIHPWRTGKHLYIHDQLFGWKAASFRGWERSNPLTYVDTD